MFIEVSKNLKKLSKLFPENLYIVGGYVRNKLLGFKGGDVDLASSVDIEEVSNRLKNTEFQIKIKNIRLGSIEISCRSERYEYTCFRKEVYGNDGSHFPISIEKTDDIEEDAKRRDFTINAVYYNINKDECVDFKHGIADLAQGVLRCPIDAESTMQNDGERILRLVRIAGELNFRIEKSTLQAAKKNIKNLQDIHGSRKNLEIEKILYCDRRYQRNKKSLQKSLALLNVLRVWRGFDLQAKKVRYDKVFKVEDRFLGLLIDIVDSEKPKCVKEFLDKFLKEQFGYNNALAQQTILILLGYYDALQGMKNKDYFFKYFDCWSKIYPLLGAVSKRIQNKYNFFFKIIIEHSLAVRFVDLKIDEEAIKEHFPNIEKKNYTKILEILLSKVFDGEVVNNKEELLFEIKKNLSNF